MNTKHLEYMLEVARCQSISKAARKLNIAQPSLSTAISALEDELGVALFERSLAGVTITEQGEQLLEVAVDILHGVDQMQQLARKDIHLNGQIRIAIVPAASSNLLVDLIALAQERYPQLSIEIEEKRPHHVFQQVVSGAFNLGITAVPQESAAAHRELFQEKRLMYQPLYQDQLCLFAAPQHPLTRQTSVTIADICRYPLAGFGDDFYPSKLSVDIPEGLALETMFRQAKYRLNNLGNIQKIVSKGLAVAVLPRRIWQQDDANPYNLTTVDIAQANTHVEAGMIYRSSLLSTAEKRIMELLQEICGQAG